MTDQYNDPALDDPITNMNRHFQQLLDRQNAEIRFLLNLLDDVQYQEYEKWSEEE